MSFRPVRRAKRAANAFIVLHRTVVASLSVAILRAGAMGRMAFTPLRMALRTGVAVLAALPVVAPI